MSVLCCHGDAETGSGDHQEDDKSDQQTKWADKGDKISSEGNGQLGSSWEPYCPSEQCEKAVGDTLPSAVQGGTVRSLH
jgi:hypothetical protein